MNTEKLFWSTKEISQYLSCSRQHINKLITTGQLKAHRLGTIYRVANSDLQDYLKKTEVVADIISSDTEVINFD